MSCGRCNTGLKTTHFPLKQGCTPLSAHQQPPGAEQALLIDPTAIDPTGHIVFERHNNRWQAMPRDDSPEGEWTIHVLQLNSPGLLDNYESRVEELASHARLLDRDIAEYPLATRSAWGAPPLVRPELRASTSSPSQS